MLIIEKSESKKEMAHGLSVIPSSRQNARQKNTLSHSVYMHLTTTQPFEVVFSGSFIKIEKSLTLYLNRISKQISIETE